MIRSCQRRLEHTMAALALLVLGACGEESSPLRVVPVAPAASRVVAGAEQVGTVAQRTPEALAVLVMDRFDNPVPDVEVTFSVSEGGGAVEPAVTRTGRDGIARASWTLGTKAGWQTATAEAPGLAPVRFSARAEPGPPVGAVPQSGDAQAGPAGSGLAEPLVVQVTDAYGNGVAGVTVQWEVTAGGGSVDPATSVTDATGLASTRLTLGPTAGPNAVVARPRGLAPVVFTATALDPFDLSIAAVYLVQSVQTPAGDVPLVAGRDAYLRVFVVATEPNSARPDVYVEFFDGATRVAAYTLEAPSSSVPTAVDEGSLGSSWNLLVPGSLVVPGLGIRVTVDPNDKWEEWNEDNNVFPASGGVFPVDVRTPPVFDIRFVPVSVAGVTGDVNPTNMQRYLEDALKVYPLPGANAQVRSQPLASSVSTTGTAAAWNTIISEVRVLRIAEGSQSHYYGVLATVGGTAYCGLGYVGYPVAIGLDRCGSWTAAHEWGHNFGRHHVPCGNPSNPDPLYPYPNGSIGVYGFDPATGQLKRPSTHVDLMSYCEPEWISDYTFRAVLEFREAEASGRAAFAAAREPALVVWGRMNGRSLTLEPAFEVETRPALPAEPGPYTLQGLDASGAVVFELSFAGEALGHGPADERHFAYALPASLAQPHRLERLRLVGPGVPAAEIARPPVAARARAQAAPVLEARATGEVELRWHAAASPLVVVRDPGTGDVLAFARGGAVRLHTDARQLELIVSDGIRSTRQRAAVRR